MLTFGPGFRGGVIWQPAVAVLTALNQNVGPIIAAIIAAKRGMASRRVFAVI